MDRSAIKPSMLREHLEKAERHVSEAERHVAQQRELVAELQRDGHGADEALRLLGQFEEMHAMHVADRDRILGELNSCSKDES